MCGVSEFLDDCLKFFDCACDCLVVFEFVLDGDAEELCVCVLFEGSSSSSSSRVFITSGLVNGKVTKVCRLRRSTYRGDNRCSCVCAFGWSRVLRLVSCWCVQGWFRVGVIVFVGGVFCCGWFRVGVFKVGFVLVCHCLCRRCFFSFFLKEDSVLLVLSSSGTWSQIRVDVFVNISVVCLGSFFFLLARESWYV